MDRHLYKAAAKGNIEPFKGIAKDKLGSIVYHNKHTVLHVNIESQAKSTRNGQSVSTEFVKWILEMCPSLLVQVNAKGDSPLHVAAKCGHLAVVEVLIEFAKNHPQELESGVETVRQVIGMTNEEQNTALHEAVQYNSLDVAEILMQTDPNFPYSANNNCQTPFDMATKKRSKEIVTIILENCPSAVHDGLNGENALHAAIKSRNIGMIALLLEKNKSLSAETDRHGWTPLHYAAYLSYTEATSMLLEFGGRSIAYIGDKDHKMTILHLAAGQNNILDVIEIMRLCPECYTLVDNRGWNVLHFAMVSFSLKDLKILLDIYPILINLINEKDGKGNTPLHILAALHRDSSYEVVPRNSEGDYYAVNKKNINVLFIIYYGYPEIKKEIHELSRDFGSGRQYSKGVISTREVDTEKFEKRRQKFRESRKKEAKARKKEAKEYEKIRTSHLIVAALIATVSFAAAFTIPGGYKSDNGTAILKKNTAFQAFIITDAIAMLFSLSSVFIHFLTSLDTENAYTMLLEFSTKFTMISMGAMVIAFVTGTYAMLAPSLGLAIVTCLIGLTFFLIGLSVLREYKYGRIN